MKKILLLVTLSVLVAGAGYSQHPVSYVKDSEAKSSLVSGLSLVNLTDLIAYTEIASKYFTGIELDSISRLKIYDPFDNRYRSLPGFCFCLLSKMSNTQTSLVNPIKAGLMCIINNEFLFNSKIILKEGKMISFREYLLTLNKVIL